MEAAAIVCIWGEGELGVSCRGKRMCGVSVWGGTAVTRARAGVPREEELSASCSLASFVFVPLSVAPQWTLGVKGALSDGCEDHAFIEWHPADETHTKRAQRLSPDTHLPPLILSLLSLQRTPPKLSVTVPNP